MTAGAIFVSSARLCTQCDGGLDAGLAEILKAHILKVAPAQNAVAQAKDAILKLAAERASPVFLPES